MGWQREGLRCQESVGVHYEDRRSSMRQSRGRKVVWGDALRVPRIPVTIKMKLEVYTRDYAHDVKTELDVSKGTGTHCD